MLRPPEDCPDMPTLREQIDALDAQLVALLARRAGYIDRAAEIKETVGLPARIPDRVEEVIQRVRAKADVEKLDPDLVEALWRSLIEWSIRRETRVLGVDPAGSDKPKDSEDSGA